MRMNGTVLYKCPDLSESHYQAERGVQGRFPDIVEGIVQADHGAVYAWLVGHAYRNGTTPDKLAAGCRISFERDPVRRYLVTGLSWKLAENTP